MRLPQDWRELLLIEPTFLELERQVRNGEINDFRQILAGAFAWHAWDMLPEERLFSIFLPFLRQQLARAVKAMPAIYADRLAAIDSTRIRSPQDWYDVPLLVKDDDPDHQLRGFRQAATLRPLVMCPTDAGGPVMVFGSGGSLGAPTPTFVTQADRAREVQAWQRGMDYHGLVLGDRALYTYNTTHKGGQWMQESLWLRGVQVCLRRHEETPEQVLENIKSYSVNLLFTVQPPFQENKVQPKTAGINLESLVAASLENPQYAGLLLPDEHGHKQIEFIFLGGFEIVPYALKLVQDYLAGTPVATLLGSSEAIPQACSTHPGLTPHAVCHFNNLHLLQAPHYIELLKPDGKAWVPVAKGEQGLLVYTSWARDGTIWVRYAPGDVATLLMEEGECPCGLYSPVITNVHRMDSLEREGLLIQGCAAG